MSKLKIHQSYKNKKGEKVPSVTQILSILSKPALIHWAWDLGVKGIDYRKYRDDKADIGTLTHQRILAHLSESEVDLSQYPQDQIQKSSICFQKYLDWEQGKNMMKHYLEEPMVSEKYGFGGTPDALVFVNGELTLMDFKTSKSIYKEYFYQLGGYAVLVSEVLEYKPEQYMILRIGRDEDEGFEVLKKDNIQKEIDIFLSCLNLYKLINSKEEEYNG